MLLGIAGVLSKSKLKPVGYPWQPYEWQPSCIVTLKKQQTESILSTYAVLTKKTKEVSGLEEKLNKICPAAKNMPNDLTLGAAL